MVPLLRIAYLDESECWDRKIRRAAGRICGIYLYDKHWHVHCCEPEPSYELYLIDYLTELRVTDRIHKAMMASTVPNCVMYAHTREIDELPCRRRRWGDSDFDPFRIGSVSCTTSLPGPFPRDHGQAIAEAQKCLHANGIIII